jgi:hypothetical protein
VDAGAVGLRVTGTSIDDDGVRTTSDSEILTSDITALATDQYLETSKKWLGTATFELFIVSGSPTTYSLDFNYGFSKYEDFGNNDFTVQHFELIGKAGSNDSGFNAALFLHSSAGWTYAATGFEPGGTSIAVLGTDYGTDDNITNGDYFAYKRANLSQFVDGSDSQGIVILVETSTGQAIEFLDAHVGVLGLSSNGITGSQGPQGVIGAGLQGPTGADGGDGVQGPQGNAGVGTQGSQGDIGPTGSGSTVAGPQGNQGNDGPTGGQGEIGPTGVGVQGPQGNDGAGVQGPQGGQGWQGSDSTVAGPQGPTGVGVQGPQGDIGPTGADSTVAGPQGSQGWQGNQGPQGWQGDAGSTGADSTVAGPQGNQGPTGAGGVGATCFIYKFDSATADADPGQGLFRLNNASASLATQAYVDVFSEAGADLSNLLLAIGKVGSRLYLQTEEDATAFAVYDVLADAVLVGGATGYIRFPSIGHIDSGNAFAEKETILCLGVAAATGTQGPQGSDGPGGVQGNQGWQGWQGSQGDDGPTGADSTVEGPQGFQGNVGFQGVTGTAVGVWTTGRSSNVSNSYLEQNTVPTNLAPLVLPVDANIAALSVSTDGVETWDGQVRVNGATVPSAVIGVTGVDTESFVLPVPVELNAGDTLATYCLGTSISKPQLMVWLTNR